MRKFTKKDYDSLKHFEEKFSCAINGSYVTGLVKDDLDKIGIVYYECLGQRLNQSCSSCVMNAIKRVGRLYFKFKDERKRK